jgi:hypothetical protein
MWLVAALTFASGVVVAVRMTETLRRPAAPATSPTCVEPTEHRRVVAGKGLGPILPRY